MFSFVRDRSTGIGPDAAERSVEGIEPRTPPPERAQVFQRLEKGLHLMETGMQRLHERIRSSVTLTEGIRPDDFLFLQRLTHALFPPSKPLPCPDDMTLSHLGEDTVLSFFKLAVPNQQSWARLRDIAEQTHNPIFATRLLDLLYEERFRQGMLREEDVAVLDARTHHWMAAVRQEEDPVPVEWHVAKIRELYWRQECEPLVAQTETMEEFVRIMHQAKREQPLACDRDHVRVQAIKYLLRLGWDEEAKEQQTHMEDPLGIFEATLAFAETFASRKSSPTSTRSPERSYRHEPERGRWQAFYQSALELYHFQSRFPSVGATRTDLAEWRSVLLQAQLRLGLQADAADTAAAIQPSFERAEYIYAPYVEQALATDKDPDALLRRFVQEMNAAGSEDLIATHLGLIELRAGLALVRKQYKTWKEQAVPADETLSYLRQALQDQDGISAQVILLLLPVHLRSGLFLGRGWSQQEIALGNVTVNHVAHLYASPAHE